MKAQLKRNASVKVFSFILGFIISGVILIDGLRNERGSVLSTSGGGYDSLKSEIEYNKTLITNSYLLGVSIYKLKESLD